MYPFLLLLCVAYVLFVKLTQTKQNKEKLRQWQYLPVAQMIASISSTDVPSVNWTPDDVRRAMPGRTCTLPDIILRGRSSFTTTKLTTKSWFGRSPYRAWSKREFSAFWKKLVVRRFGSKLVRNLVKRLNTATSTGRPLSHTRRTHHAPFMKLRYT